MEERDNIIVMGGSFNPPTIAHLKVIQAAMDALNAEMGYLAPVSRAYLKRKMVRAGCGHLCVPVETRLEMLRAMTADDTRIHIYEGDLQEPFSITPRTMERVQQRHPEAWVWFVLGEDKLELLESMTRKWAFLPRFGAVVFARGGDLERRIVENEVLSPCREAIAVVEPPANIEGVSSTAVREYLFDPGAVADMLHPSVLALLRRLNPSDYPEEIIAFKGEWAFLGNDYPSPVTFEGIGFPSTESAFQASKSDDDAVRRQFAKLGRDKVRRRGNRLTPRPGWEDGKVDIMKTIVRQKFLQNPELIEPLLATGNRRLIHGGDGMNDTFWGVNTVIWEGENQLGRILMALRKELGKEMSE